MNDDFRDDPEYIRACLFGDEPDSEPTYPWNKQQELWEELKQWALSPAKGDEWGRTNFDVYPGISRRILEVDNIFTTEVELLALLKQCRELPGDEHDDDVWILVSEALPQLQPHIKSDKDLKKYAKEHLNELRLRRHPNHERRHQAHAGDVARLAKRLNENWFERIDAPGEQPIDLTEAAKRLLQTREAKKK